MFIVSFAKQRPGTKRAFIRVPLRILLDNLLLLLPSITEKRTQAGQVLFPRKFLDGMLEYARLWHGNIMVAMELSRAPDWALDAIAVAEAELPFTIQPLPACQAAQRELFRLAQVVFPALVPRHTGIADICESENVSVVYDSDMSPTVRADIIRAETRNPLRRWRRLRWNRNLEARYRAALSKASGVQCNGMSVLNAYSMLTPRPLFYLNTRVRRAMLATLEEHEARAARLVSGAPLHLVFSGRLAAMKGVLDLPRVAAALKQRGVRFTLDIFGSGALEMTLRNLVERLQLADCVHLEGEIPFPDLMQRVRGESDLFVCCHPQGDPSTTFLETMSCGVPLVGYEAEGLRDIVQCAGAGWVTPRSEPDALAARITALDQNRAELADAAHTVFEFARQHTFEQTMAARVEHLEQCAVNSQS